jgi:hypothetical protein
VLTVRMEAMVRPECISFAWFSSPSISMARGSPQWSELRTAPHCTALHCTALPSIAFNDRRYLNVWESPDQLFGASGLGTVELVDWGLWELVDWGLGNWMIWVPSYVYIFV